MALSYSIFWFLSSKHDSSTAGWSPTCPVFITLTFLTLDIQTHDTLLAPPPPQSAPFSDETLSILQGPVQLLNKTFDNEGFLLSLSLIWYLFFLLPLLAIFLHGLCLIFLTRHLNLLEERGYVLYFFVFSIAHNIGLKQRDQRLK